VTTIKAAPFGRDFDEAMEEAGQDHPDRPKFNYAARGLLIKAAEEIRHLRRVNELQAAKIEVMDLFKATLFGKPHQPEYGATEDIAWQIDKIVNRL
jgi:hypothetical protein